MSRKRIARFRRSFGVIVTLRLTSGEFPERWKKRGGCILKKRGGCTISGYRTGKCGTKVMPHNWDPQVYRERAQQWRGSAATHPPGDTRNAHITLAEGYENLARLIEIDRAAMVACSHTKPA
jgi:hypothetical protein